MTPHTPNIRTGKAPSTIRAPSLLRLPDPHMQRTILFHCGPTNSGKTYACFEALKAAQHGIYAAPLRLLAMEGWQALHSPTHPAQLITGEERKGPRSATLTACTIESLSLETTYDVAVLDEIQMLACPNRGWAWTRALLGVRASTVLLAGSPEALPWIARTLALSGEAFTVKPFARKAPLHFLGPVTRLQGGDALITFSRRAAMTLRQDLQNQGFRVALIHGGLPPEVRQHQANRFAQNPDSILVATDAIGMGLNLPIARVLFTALTKYDGSTERPLSAEEIRQLAGRAGRWGHCAFGGVGTYHCDTPFPVNALTTPPITQPTIPPTQDKAWWRPVDHLSTSTSLTKGLRAAQRLRNTPVSFCLDDALFARAHLIDSYAFPRAQALALLAAPASPQDQDGWQVFCGLLHAWNNGRLTLCAPPSHNRAHALPRLETWFRKAALWRWIDRHWPNRFFPSTTLDAHWTTAIACFEKTLSDPMATRGAKTTAPRKRHSCV